MSDMTDIVSMSTDLTLNSQGHWAGSGRISREQGVERSSRDFNWSVPASRTRVNSTTPCAHLTIQSIQPRVSPRFRYSSVAGSSLAPLAPTALMDLPA